MSADTMLDEYIFVMSMCENMFLPTQMHKHTKRHTHATCIPDLVAEGGCLRCEGRDRNFGHLCNQRNRLRGLGPCVYVRGCARVRVREREERARQRERERARDEKGDAHLWDSKALVARERL